MSNNHPRPLFIFVVNGHAPGLDFSGPSFRVDDRTIHVSGARRGACCMNLAPA